MRVQIAGCVVANGGDAAIMAAQLQMFERAHPGSQVVLNDLHPSVAERIFPQVAALPFTYNVVTTRAPGKLNALRRRLNEVRVRWAARTLGVPFLARALLTGPERRQVESLAAADLVAYTGGTSLVETYSLRSKFFELDLAFALGRPVVLLPQSMGPFRKAENVAAINRVVRRSEVVFVRDGRSRGHLAAIGCDMTKVHVAPDVVFGLMREGALERLTEASLPDAGMRVAVSVRDCRPFFPSDREQAQERYAQAIRDLVSHLVRGRGASVTFVSTCQGVPEYWTDDSLVASGIAAGLPVDVAASVSVDHVHRSPLELRDHFGEYDLLVATRLHAAILALDAGTPVLPIAYEFKTREVMGDHGLGEFVLDVDDLTGERLVDACERFTARLPEVRASVAGKLRLTVEQSEQTEKILSSVTSARR